MGIFAASAEQKAYSHQAAYTDLILMGNDNHGTIRTTVEELSKRWLWAYDRTYTFVERLAKKEFFKVDLCEDDVTIAIQYIV